MKARVVHTKIWRDEFFNQLSTSEKLLFIYFLTNDRIDILGVYEITTREIMFDTGISDETIRTAKQKLEAAEKIFFKDNYVLIKNCGKYQNFTGEKNEVAKTKSFGILPSNIQRWYCDTLSIPYGYPMDTPPIPSVISNQYSVINNQKSVIEGLDVIKQKRKELGI